MRLPIRKRKDRGRTREGIPTLPITVYNQPPAPLLSPLLLQAAPSAWTSLSFLPPTTPLVPQINQNKNSPFHFPLAIYPWSLPIF